ncbi:MAG: ATP-dependent helicase [Lachnospiraceae bacterium]|nr:ATP-dependent helicase [Lachnospiraceae bacterium]
MFDQNNLSKEQLLAATYTKSDILLAAGPGSGKTHTMTSRIMYLTEKSGVDPASILVITFTKDAATGMQKRFAAASEYPLPVAFGTFHSIFYNMMREWGKNNLLQILYDRNRSEIAGSVVKKYIGSGKTCDYKGTLSDFLSAVSVYKNTLDEERAAECLKEAKGLFRDMFGYYENIRRKSGLMDFDDMVYDCRNLLLHDRSFIRKWKNRFSHILIDEFQDINKAQYETVKLMAGDRTRIFAVGDDDQSIYGFRGSEPSILKRFLEERNAVLMHLNTNYRSSPQIVKASVYVIDENKNRIPKAPVSNRSECESILCIKGFEDHQAEYEEILRLILSRKGSLAVLFRTNIEMQTFASYLTSKNTGFRIREKTTGIFDHFILRDIYSYLHVIYGLPSEDHIKAIINKPFRGIDPEYLIGCEGNLSRIIKNIYGAGELYRPGNVIKNLNDLKKDLEFMKTLSVSAAITYLYKKTGYEKYVLLKAGDEYKKAEYIKILTEAKNLLNNAETLEDIDMIKEKYERNLKRSMKSREKDLPDLMTVHASKGLEFKTVIIPDVNEGTFPHDKIPDETSIEEERRIFYVAMTRACDNLYLFYRKASENGKAMPGRFLTPLLKNNMHINEKGKNR